MGIYDTVEFKCPKCNTSIYEQSKAGKCELRGYNQSRVPVAIADAFLGASVYCHGCGSNFVIDTVLPPVQYVSMELKERE